MTLDLSHWLTLREGGGGVLNNSHKLSKLIVKAVQKSDNALASQFQFYNIDTDGFDRRCVWSFEQVASFCRSIRVFCVPRHFPLSCAHRAPTLHVCHLKLATRIHFREAFRSQHRLFWSHEVWFRLQLLFPFQIALRPVYNQSHQNT